MKRVLICVLVAILCLTGCGQVFKGKTESEIVANLEETSEASLVNENNEFVFKEVYRKNKKAEYSDDIESICLYLGEMVYYPVFFPRDVEYVTDNSKYIYATDGSASISVVSNIDIYQFSESVFVDNPETLANNLIVTKRDSKDEKKEAALHVAGDKAIILRTYNNEEVFNTVVDGLQKNSCGMAVYDALDLKDASSKIPRYKDDAYTVSITAGLGDEIQKIYTFDDNGSLTISRELRDFKTAIKTQAVKMAIVAGTDKADVYYNDGTRCYIEIDDIVFGAYAVNFNTTLTCFGNGDEAKFNTIRFLEAQ